VKKLLITLSREIFRDINTLGEMFIDNKHFAYTLERPLKTPVKVIKNGIEQIEIKENYPMLCCIPEGKYQIKLEESPHFKMILPTLQNVSNRSHILIHTANKVEELKGCIAIGFQRINLDIISQSKIAVNKLLEILISLKEEIYIEIKNK
jgi:hypothetical protein